MAVAETNLRVTTGAGSRCRAPSPVTVAPWALIVFVAVAAVVWALASGFTCQWRGFLRPGTVLAVVVSGSVFYRRREPRFTLCLVALMQITMFSAAFVCLTYLATAMNRPLVDGSLAAWDHALGFSLPDIVAWSVAHPLIARPLDWVYASMLWQTAALVGILGLLGDRKALETFVLRMMVAGLVTFAIFLFMPAEGPFSAYGYAPSKGQAVYLDHFHTLRSGARTCFDLADAQGLITFPSFHTIWAILIAAAVWHRRWVRVPFALLNAGVIASTLTTGWHYGVDVLTGIVIAAIVCWTTTAWQRRWEPSGDGM